MPRVLRLSFFIAVALLLGACATGAGRTAAGQAAPDFSALVATRSAAVVDISTLRIGRDQGGEDAEREFTPENDFADRLAWPLAASQRLSEIRDLASGLILTSDGLILTSAHVVTNIDEAQVRLDDGRRFSARVIGADRRTDVALVKIEATGLPVSVIGNSERLKPGDWVAAIGAPFGFHGSVTTGVVSAVDRFIGGVGEIPFIQTDVAVNPGSSGGPLFDSRGEVVGINSMIYSGSGGFMGLSFAVPINLAMRIADRLRAEGVVRRAHLGAELQEMTPALAQSFALPVAAAATGAVVVRVDEGSPARAAGLERGDVLTSFAGAPVGRFADLPLRIAAHPVGQPTSLEIWRNGAKKTLWVTLTEDRPRGESPPSDAAPEWADGLGLSLRELSPAQRLQLRIDGGLMVSESAGLARSEGVRAGDIIVALNAQRLERIDDFRRGLAAMPGGQPVALLVLRDRRLAYVPVRLPDTRPATTR